MSRHTGLPICSEHGDVGMSVAERQREAEERRNAVTAVLAERAWRSKFAAEQEQRRQVNEAYQIWMARGADEQQFIDEWTAAIETRSAITADEFLDQFDFSACFEQRVDDRGYETRVRDGYADLEDRYGDTGAELRYVSPDGTPVFGPEPDGEVRDGRAYDSRWWVNVGSERPDGWRVLEDAALVLR